MTDHKADFKNKLAHFYTTEYDAVFLKVLVRGVLEDDGNARNKADVGWRDFFRVLRRHVEKNGCHVVAVEAEGTPEECARCGVGVEKRLWVRTHSYPSCGFRGDRDRNAAFNALSRGLTKLGVDHSEGTPVETVLPVDTHSVSAKRVGEARSPCLTEPPKAAG